MLKVALPWQLGHTAAFALAAPDASGAASVAGLACGTAACLVAAVYTASLFIGSGRTPYDRAANTRVIRRGAI